VVVAVAVEVEDEGEDTNVLPDVDWTVDLSATSSCAGFFGEPSLMKYVNVFLTIVLEAHASSYSYWLSLSLVQVVGGGDPRLG
jgi:hypothetical protein